MEEQTRMCERRLSTSVAEAIYHDHDYARKIIRADNGVKIAARSIVVISCEAVKEKGEPKDIESKQSSGKIINETRPKLNPHCSLKHSKDQQIDTSSVRDSNCPRVLNDGRESKPAGKESIGGISNPMSSLERISRYAFNYAINNGMSAATEDVIQLAERATREIQPPPEENDFMTRLIMRQARATAPTLQEADFDRIRELYPPTLHLSQLNQEHRLDGNPTIEPHPRCIYPGEYEQPINDTMRCPSNYNVHLSSYGSQSVPTPFYQRTGNYLAADAVNYLPVPSIWTPRHALMNIAPSISSAGFYVSPFQEETTTSDDSSEEEYSDTSFDNDYEDVEY